MSAFDKVIANPSEALLAVGRENSQLHEELAACYAELDRMRNGLTAILSDPANAVAYASKALNPAVTETAIRNTIDARQRQ